MIKFIVAGQEKYIAWNIGGGDYFLTGLTGDSAHIKNTICNTSIQAFGLLTDEFPVFVNNKILFLPQQLCIQI